jgi:hypothetical protein
VFDEGFAAAEVAFRVVGVGESIVLELGDLPGGVEFLKFKGPLTYEEVVPEGVGGGKVDEVERVWLFGLMGAAGAVVSVLIGTLHGGSGWRGIQGASGGGSRFGGRGGIVVARVWCQSRPSAWQSCRHACVCPR